MPDTEPNVFQQWGEKINWEVRVKAVCKPCWELKYCPYGPLVEEFEIGEANDDRRCRIFGHICPVFLTAEPLTETRELRNISRRIPRTVQFRVLKRDNQICAVCERPVLDADIHFDHVIPWSKGGPTEEHNIRLLCASCNRKRGAGFEAEHLVESVFEHTSEPLEADVLEILLDVSDAAREWNNEHEASFTPADLAAVFEVDEVTRFEVMLAEFADELASVYSARRPSDLAANEFRALKRRWGFADGYSRKLKEAAEDSGLAISQLVKAENTLLRRLGWYISTSARDRKIWEKT